MRKLLLSLGLLLFLSLSLAGCNDDNAEAEGVANFKLDFLVDVVSGEVFENPEGDGFIIQLEVSPLTVFIEEKPGSITGTISTEFYFENFDEVIDDVPPNAILTYRAGDGTAVALAVRLRSVVFDASESVVEIFLTSLDDVTPPGTSIELKNIEDVESPIGRALLFIDATQECASMWGQRVCLCQFLNWVNGTMFDCM